MKRTSTAHYRRNETVRLWNIKEVIAFTIKDIDKPTKSVGKTIYKIKTKWWWAVPLILIKDDFKAVHLPWQLVAKVGGQSPL